MLAVLLLAALCVAFGYAAGSWQPEMLAPSAEPDYTDYNAAQLSWVQEGIQERISELQDELTRVRAIQAGKMADASQSPE